MKFFKGFMVFLGLSLGALPAHAEDEHFISLVNAVTYPESDSAVISVYNSGPDDLRCFLRVGGTASGYSYRDGYYRSQNVISEESTVEITHGSLVMYVATYKPNVDQIREYWQSPYLQLSEVNTQSVTKQCYRISPRPIEPRAGHLYNIISKYSGKCLDVKDHARHNGATLQQWDCTGEPHQKFTLVDMGGYYSLRGLQSGRCLSVEYAYTSDWARAIQWECKASNDQKVWLERSYEDNYSIHFAHSGKCLAIDGPSYANGEPVRQKSCNGSSDQEWIFVEQF